MLDQCPLARRERSNPRDLRDEQVQRGEANGRGGGKPRRGLSRKRRDGGVADEKNVEVLSEVLVTGGRRADAHVGIVPRQQDVPDTLFLEKAAKGRVAFTVVDHEVAQVNLDRFHHRHRQFPEPSAVERRPRVETRKLLEVAGNRSLGIQRDRSGDRLPVVIKGREFGLELPLAFLPLLVGGLLSQRAVDLAANRVLRSRQAVTHQQTGLGSHGLEERIDDLGRVVEHDLVLGGCALKRNTGGLGRPPALAVIDAPGMHHDHGRPV